MSNNDLFLFQKNKVTFNNHQEYLDLLYQIKPYIYAFDLADINNNPDDKIINFALDNCNLLATEKTSRWLGTIGSKKIIKYTFEFNDKFFKFIKQFAAFYLDEKTFAELNDYPHFTQADIAFFDANQDVVFYATCHENIGFINPKYIN